MSITWDEIRNTFYSKVSRNQILHTYVQSKPVNDVVYGQVVFDKTSLANKMLKESPIKVGHYQIPVVPTKILFMVNFNRVVDSVVEPFHFGPAPAPASQDGGSSSSHVVHNLLLKIFFITSFTSQFIGTCFIQRKVRVLCFALPVLYLKRHINFNIFVYFSSLNIGSELELEL